VRGASETVSVYAWLERRFPAPSAVARPEGGRVAPGRVAAHHAALAGRGARADPDVSDTADAGGVEAGVDSTSTTLDVATAAPCASAAARCRRARFCHFSARSKMGHRTCRSTLHPSAKGKRIKFSESSRQVVDGPFTETKKLIAGYWIWQVRSIEEAVEWARRCPGPHSGEDAELERSRARRALAT